MIIELSNCEVQCQERQREDGTSHNFNFHQHLNKGKSLKLISSDLHMCGLMPLLSRVRLKFSTLVESTVLVT